MNIYENNKQLLTAMGGDSANLATDFEVRKAILGLLGGDSSDCNSIYEVDKQILNIYLEGGGGTGGDITLSPITITENGVYTAGVGNGYNKVTVNVEIPECPEIPLTAITINSNGTYIPEEGGYNEVIVDVAGGGGAGGEKVKLKKISFDDGSVVNGTIDIDNVYNKIDINYISDMSEMFGYCYLLTHLDLSGFVTGTVTFMYGMFYGCSSLQSLDVSGWDINNVFSMDSLFYDCSSLRTLDVSGWDTNRMEYMNLMFYNCSSLTQLDLTNWNIGSAIDIENFSAYSGIINYVGGITIDDVIANNITILSGFRCNASGVMSAVADRASLRALINGLLPVPQDESDPDYGLYDSIGLYQSNLDTLTEEDLALATEKGWTLWAFE